MDNFFDTEEELLQGIIDVKGDCINVSWCIMCPFSNTCIFSAVKNARLLSREKRVKKAVDRLFFKLIEEELDD